MQSGEPGEVVGGVTATMYIYSSAIWWQVALNNQEIERPKPVRNYVYLTSDSVSRSVVFKTPCSRCTLLT